MMLIAAGATAGLVAALVLIIITFLVMLLIGSGEDYIPDEEN